MDLTEQSITSGFRSQTDATCAAVTCMPPVWDFLSAYA